ncbi:MAG: septum formation protein Maf [Planctomycetes bacterium]|nr:septum formation protein Maf [Planctomycetota bacterium]
MDRRVLSRPIILASLSPRRSSLLAEAGIPFEAVAPRYAEPPPPGVHADPAAFAESASFYKAASLADDHPDRLILAADTVVALGDRVFGKPADLEDARRILTALLGATQQVITGVTLLDVASGRRLISHDVTHVTMRAMSERELEDYLARGDWEGKAGAYGIQGQADRFIEKCDGSYSNVVGLPVELVQRMLKEFI